MLLLPPGCADDPDVSVTRDTDELEFPYSVSTQSFTIRTDGSWNLTTEEDWIHMDPAQGVGDGRSYQYVNVTVDRNAGEKRTGEVVIHAAGRDLKVFIRQDDGILALKEAYLLGTLLEGEEIAGIYVAIPYEKALGTELMDVEVELDGEGASGIECEPVQGEELQEGDGEVLVAGHHGSKYSTSQALLDAFRPEYALISVGADNGYGHPAPETVERIAASGGEIWRTDRSGTVAVRFNGQGRGS